MNYNKMVKLLEECPQTWVAALFLVALKRCLQLEVFIDIVALVSTAKEKVIKEKASEPTKPKKN